MPSRQTHLLTRFGAVDEDAAARIGVLLRGTATEVASEPGHVSYAVFAVEGDPTTLYVLESWASVADARRHADRVLGDGAVDRVLPLLGDRLDTVTLVPIVLSSAAGDRGAIA